MTIAIQKQERQTTEPANPDLNRGKQEQDTQRLSAVDSGVDSEDGEIETTLGDLRLILLTASLTLAVFMVSIPNT